MHQLTSDHQTADFLPTADPLWIRDRLSRIGIPDLADSSGSASDILAKAAEQLEQQSLTVILQKQGGIQRWISRILQLGPEDVSVPHILRMKDGSIAILRNRIAQGGFGDVWLADTCEGTVVAKILRPDRADGNVARHRFRAEAEILRSLTIPGIPRLIEHGETNGQSFLLLEPIPGITLRDLLKSTHEPLPAAFVRHFAHQCTATLAAIHGRTVVHGDLKPENIMIDRHGEPWIIDFGLSRKIDDSSTRHTEEGQTVGTKGFIDPQTIGRALERDRASDVYALGVTLFELYGGAPLFSKREWEDVILHYENITATGTIADRTAWWNGLMRSKTGSFDRRKDRDRSFENIILRMLEEQAGSDSRRPDASIFAAALKRDGKRSIGRLIETRVSEEMLDPQTLIEHIHNAYAPGMHRRIAGLSIVSAAVIAGIIALFHSARETSDPHAPSAEETVSDTPKQLSRMLMLDGDAIRVSTPDGKTLLTKTPDAHLQSSDGSVGVAIIPCSAEELCHLLESLKPGASAGLPKRAYTIYLFAVRDRHQERSLLKTTRGVIVQFPDGCAFVPNDALTGRADIIDFLDQWEKTAKDVDQVMRGSVDQKGKYVSQIAGQVKTMRKQAGLR